MRMLHLTRLVAGDFAERWVLHRAIAVQRSRK